MTSSVSLRLRPPAMTRAERRLWLAAVVALVLVTADVVVGGLLTHLDTQVRDLVQDHPVSTPWWWTAVAQLGDLRIAIPLVAVAGIVCSQARWRWWPAVFLYATFGLCELAVLAMKVAVGRPGPGVWADREGYPGYFPSGHSATSLVAVALVVFVVTLVVRGVGHSTDLVRLSRLALALGLVAGVLTGSRAMVADTHWATDVVGGLLLGLVVGLPGLAWGRSLARRGGGE